MQNLVDVVKFVFFAGMITPDIPVKLKRGSFLPPVGEKKPVPAPETDFFQPQPNQPNNETESSERSLVRPPISITSSMVASARCWIFSQMMDFFSPVLLFKSF